MANKFNFTKFASAHKAGFCKVPRNLGTLPSLSASDKFMAPSTLDLRDLCTPTEDQGNKPWCAAYSAANWAENILWRVKDYPENVDPAPIYKWAKQNDDDPDGDGTTLVAVLAALRGGLFDASKCKVQVIRKTRLSLKYAIHKFGCCLGAFDIDSSWWGVKKSAPVILGDGEPHQGGHAVIVCGYDRTGIWIQNSWGKEWGEWGFAKMPWSVWDEQWLYGAVLTNCLDGLRLNA